jgi:Family of unknown function (DUF6114)
VLPDGQAGSSGDTAPEEPAVVSAPDKHESRLHRGRTSFRHWRRSRPFWGGLLLVLGGGEILLTVRAPLPVIIHIGLQGTASYVVPLVIMICGLLVWVSPQQRLFYGLVGMVLALVSWLTSNLGGFFIGMLQALIGASLALAWTATAKPPKKRERPAEPAAPPPDEHDGADPGHRLLGEHGGLSGADEAGRSPYQPSQPRYEQGAYDRSSEPGRHARWDSAEH